MKTLPRSGVVAVVASVAALALAVPSWSAAPASARRAPILEIKPFDPTEPVEVPLPTDDPSTADLSYTIDVTGGPATNVTVTLSGTGLTVPPPKNLGTISSEEVELTSVGATTGGFHQLTFTVTADGAAPASSTLSYVWAPTGSMTVTAGASLAKQYYGTTGLYAENGTSYLERAMLLFLSPSKAFYGVPDGGLPKCPSASTTATKGCMAYAYDPATHLLQVGGSIGFVDRDGVHTIGLGITDYQDGEDFAHRDWLTRYGFPKSHARLNGSWAWAYGNTCFQGCFSFAALTLRRDGTFSLSDNYRKKRTVKGRYMLSRHGRLVLRGSFGSEAHAFALRLDKHGEPDPRVGIAIGYGKHANADVAFLKPAKR